MSLSFEPRWMPCPDCGESLERAERERHECDPARRLDYELFQLRDEIAGFDDAFTAWLATADGQFQMFLAEWQREEGA